MYVLKSQINFVMGQQNQGQKEDQKQQGGYQQPGRQGEQATEQQLGSKQETNRKGVENPDQNEGLDEATDESSSRTQR